MGSPWCQPLTPPTAYGYETSGYEYSWADPGEDEGKHPTCVCKCTCRRLTNFFAYSERSCAKLKAD